MPLELSATTVTALVAGTLIVAVGVFVLLAKWDSPLHRLFFLLALFDGASTILFSLSYAHTEVRWQRYLMGLYWYYFIAFTVTLWLFAFLFPRPAWRRSVTIGAATFCVATGGVLIALYAWRHDLFWGTGDQPGLASVIPAPLGNITTAAFLAAAGFMVVKLTRELTRLSSASHRRQSAYVLGGMALAFVPQATTYTAYAFNQGLVDALIFIRLDAALVYWVSLATTIGMLVSAIYLFRTLDPEVAGERRFVLAAYCGVAGLSLAALWFSSLEAVVLLRRIALVAYPLLLAYAIVRFEIFDIDRRLRRASTAALTVAGAALVFVLAQEALEGVVETRLAAVGSPRFAAGGIAAMVVAATSIPLARTARRASSRLIPALTADQLRDRQLEIYRHSLQGAFEDGILADRESRTLERLRESLGVSLVQHEEMVREIRGAMAAGDRTVAGGPGPIGGT